MEAVLDRHLLDHASKPLALGLSGGGDSVALLRLACDWAERRGRRILALTVDHGLNPDSAAWTQFAGAAAEAAGAEWRPLVWSGAKPVRGLPAAARDARHRLLAEAAREAGASVVLLGHTLDDQLEADVMRAGDAPSLGRLRTWSSSPVWPEGRGIFLLRPLLQARRAELRVLLRELGLVWLDDPANDNPVYARARARKALSSPSTAQDGGAMATVASAHLAPKSQDQTDWVCTPDGRILAPRRQIDGRFCAAALLCAAGSEVPPRGDKLAFLISRLQAGEDFTATLSGARVSADGDAVWFSREAGERGRGGLAPLPLSPGRSAVWDGRYEIKAQVAGLAVHPAAGRIAALDLDDRRRLKSLPPTARGAVPVLVLEGAPPVLPRPFGEGPAIVHALVEPRLRGALGLVSHEE